jgi:hypothetical protein
MAGAIVDKQCDQDVHVRSRVSKLLTINCCEYFVSPLDVTAAMEEKTPNINVVHSVWRRLKKAKIQDLQPIRDVKGGGCVTDKSKPITDGTGTAGNRGSR